MYEPPAGSGLCGAVHPLRHAYRRCCLHPLRRRSTSPGRWSTSLSTLGEALGPPPNQFLTVSDPGEPLGGPLDFKGTLSGAGTALPTGAATSTTPGPSAPQCRRRSRGTSASRRPAPLRPATPSTGPARPGRTSGRSTRPSSVPSGGARDRRLYRPSSADVLTSFARSPTRPQRNR